MLYVKARSSTFYYKNKSILIDQIGEEIGVNYVLVESVRKTDSHVRVTAQLVDVASSSQIWADRFDQEINGTFSIQDDIPNVIVARLPHQLQKTLMEKVQKKPDDSYSAYEYFLKGHWLYISSAGENPSAPTSDLYQIDTKQLRYP